MADSRRLGRVLSIALALAGCHAGQNQNRATLLTHNAGLAPGDVAYVDERAPAAIDALAAEAQQLDVLCVQEFWEQAHFDALAVATASELPYSLRRASEPGPSGCDAEDGPGLDALKTCVEARCPGDTGEDIAMCVSQQCYDAYVALKTPCQTCLTDHLPLPVDTIFALCAPGAASAADALDTPALYGGSFGTGLLSRTPFLSQDSKRLDAYMVRVGVLYGRVATGAGDLDVFCTHLTSELDGLAYAGTHGTWKEEHAFEVQQLLDFVKAKTLPGNAVVLLGDLNCGPAISPSIQPEWPDNYALLTDTGFVDPFVSQSDVACTSCAGNTLRAPDADSTLIDHVLLRGFTGAAHVERVFTDLVTIQVGGAPLRTHRSDHYGLRARLER